MKMIVVFGWLLVSNKNFLLQWDRTLNPCSLVEDSFFSYD